MDKGATKRLAKFAPEVNLGIHHIQVIKHANEKIHPGVKFKTAVP